MGIKKGKRPHVPAGAYEPERVQVCVQAMILEDNGYTVEQGRCGTSAQERRCGWFSTRTFGP